MTGGLVTPESIRLAALALGTLAGLGLWTVVLSLWPKSVSDARSRTTNLTQRIALTLRDISPAARAWLSPRSDDPVSVGGVLLSPLVQRVLQALDQLLGGSDSAASLVAASGERVSLTQYRLQRGFAAVLGSAVGVLIIAGWLIVGGQSLVSGLIGVIAALSVGAVIGVGLWDRAMRNRIARRQQRLREEFPSVVELLALALAAGESLSGALGRIAERGSGELATQWGIVLRQVELGQPLAKALRESADNLGVVEISRLVDHLATAMERGSPLVDIVRSHSVDSRADHLRAILERAGKAEVWMLVPLVLLILPTTVIFAVWPSLQALQLGL